MSVRRLIEIECKSGDGSMLKMSDPIPGAICATIGRSAPVHIAYNDARELAAWLIEHAAEDPDAYPEQQMRAAAGDSRVRG